MREYIVSRLSIRVVLFGHLAFLATFVTAADPPAASSGETSAQTTPSSPVNEEALKQAESLDEQGGKALAAGRLDEAVDLRTRALEEYRKAYPAGHWRIAFTLHQLGYALQREGKSAESRMRYEQALAVHRKLINETGNTNLPNFAMTLRNLAGFERSEGQLQLAKEHLIEAIAIARLAHRNGRYNDGPAAIARNLSDLGHVYLALRDFNDAVMAYQESLSIYRAGTSAGNAESLRSVVMSLLNLGNAYFQVGNHDAATLCWLEAYNMQDGLLESISDQKELRSGLTQLCNLSSKLGAGFQSAGRLVQSIGSNRRALELRRRLQPPAEFPNGNIEIASCLNSLGMSLRANENWQEASECFEEASKMLEVLFPTEAGSQPPVLLAATRTNWGDALREVGNHEEAKDKCEQALAAFQSMFAAKDFPKGHDLVAVALRNLGSVEGALNEFDRADKHLQNALAMQHRLFTEENDHGQMRIADTYSRLARLRILQNDAHAAHDYYQKALDIGRKMYPKESFSSGHPWMRRLLKQTAQTARTLGQEDVAAGYEQEAESSNSSPPIVRLGWFVRQSSEQRRLIEEATLFSQDGQKLYREEKYEEAEVYLLRSYRIFEEAYPEPDYPLGHLDLSNGLDWLAWAAMERQDFRQAKDYFSQSLDVLRRLYPESQYPSGHAKIKRTLDGLARAYVKLELYVESRTCYTESLEIAERLYPKADFPNGHESVAWSLNGLGTAYEGENKLDLARDFYQRSVDMRRQLLASKDDANIREHHAVGLNNLAAVLKQLGDKEKAEQLFEEARSLSPSGSEDYNRRQMLSCWKTGENLLRKFDGAQAADHYSKAIEFAGKAYPKESFPKGHVDIAKSLGYLGTALVVQGNKPSEARHQLKAALAMLDVVSGGDDAVALEDRKIFLSMLASLLTIQGEAAEAKIYYQRAEALEKRPTLQQGNMFARNSENKSRLSTKYIGDNKVVQQEQQLLSTLRERQIKYPESTHSNGHYEVRTALEAIGDFYREQGQLDQAEAFLKDSLSMQRKLFEASRSVLDAHHLLNSLQEFGALLTKKNRTAEAREAYIEALSLAEENALIRNPVSRATLGLLVNDLVKLEYRPSDIEKARIYSRRLLDNGDNNPQYGMWRSLLANELAETFLGRSMFAEAFEVLSESTRLQNEALLDFSLTASEAETLNYIQFSQVSLDHLLSASQHMKSSADDVDTLYARVWERRGLIQEVLGKRYRAAHLADQDPELHRLYEDYLDTRRSLADTLAFQSQPDFAQAAKMMDQAAKLGRKKEEIERRIAKEFPQTWKNIFGAPVPYGKLVNAIPPTTAVIDFLWYAASEPASGQSSSDDSLIRTPRYAAFILRHGQPVTFVDIGEASRVDAAVLAWRKGLGNDALATEVSRLVWNPLSEHIPSEIETVYLCPDGSLTSLPWAALPAPEKQGVLLENYALAVIPSGRFLLDGLTTAMPPSQGAASFLAIGDVDYDSRPRKSENGLTTLERGVARDSAHDLKWPALPGTKNEIDAIVGLLRHQLTAGSITTRVRTGDDASVSQVVHDLPGARWAHVSTHGFFAAPEFLSAIRLKSAASPKNPSIFNMERTSVVGRNPLVLSGLVLAGANSPKSQSGEEETRGTSGILSAEAIAGLPLSDMQLIVLSACETGLGDVAGGEGVYGLQRAFHLAGARNVVASLWKVDDTATAALMNVFYHKLWQESKTPLQALREAQLTIYRNPDNVTSLAGMRGAELTSSLRGLNFDAPEKLPETETPTSSVKTSPAKHWAAFMLSGAGE